jgi:hypothetical protein
MVLARPLLCICCMSDRRFDALSAASPGVGMVVGGVTVGAGADGDLLSADAATAPPKPAKRYGANAAISAMIGSLVTPALG